MWAEQEEVFQEREETDLGPGVDHGGGVDQDPEGGEVTGQGVDQQEEAILKMGTDSTLEVTRHYFLFIASFSYFPSNQNLIY